MRETTFDDYYFLNVMSGQNASLSESEERVGGLRKEEKGASEC